MSSEKGRTVLPQSQGKDVIGMLLGFVEEVCPHRKSYKAKWMDNEDGGWVFEFQMSAARANQPLFFTLSVFQPNRSTGEWAYLHTLTIDLDAGSVANAAESTFSKLISAISNSRTEALLEVVTLACDRLRLARRHRILLAERIPQWRRLLEQGYVSLARGKQAYDRSRLLRLQAMSEADLAKEYREVLANWRAMRAAPFVPMGTVYEDGKQIAALERQHQHLQDHEHEQRRRASLSAHARLEEEIQRRQGTCAGR